MTNKQVTFGIKLSRETIRCHAEVVEELPAKTNKWSNGYAWMGKWEIDGKTYDIYVDRDRHDIFGYYAIEQ